MNAMKVIRIHTRDRHEGPMYEEAPRPEPGAGEVLVRVYAASFTPTELTWSTTWKTRAGLERSLPIPGHDLSGTIEEVGPEVSGVTIGEAVYGLTDFYRDGAQAEYTIALPGELAPKPRSLDFVEAAAVPLSALTAWQALFDHAHLAAGQTVLIHGASGGVGVFAVQLAHWRGARVIGTASAQHHALLRALGADEVIDYAATRFEEVVRGVDVVLDAVGGNTLERSWGVLKKGGMLLSIVDTPSPERAAAQGVRALFFIVQPNRAELVQIGDVIDAGQMRPMLRQVLPLAQARQAYRRGQAGHAAGKAVFQVVDEARLPRAVEEQERRALHY
jgi:NADPH:quinone reductase-like Zn-dependent oxidoreductase